MPSSAPSPAPSAFSGSRTHLPTAGSQDSLFALPPPLPAHPPRLASLPHEDGPAGASGSGEWGALFEIAAGGGDDDKENGQVVKEEVVKLEHDLSKRRSLASKMTQELEELQKRLEQAEARERALRGRGGPAGGQAPGTTGSSATVAQQSVSTA